MLPNTYLTLCKGDTVELSTAFATTGGAQVMYDGCGFTFGVGGGDIISMFLNTTHDTLIDQTVGCCSGLPSQSYGRLTPGGGFSIMTRTPGLLNAAFSPPSMPPSPTPPPPASPPPPPPQPVRLSSLLSVSPLTTSPSSLNSPCLPSLTLLL